VCARIFVVINGLLYPYILGGAEIFAHSLSNELSKRGYDVTLLGYSKSDYSSNVGDFRRRYKVVTSPSIGRFLDRLIVPLHAANLIKGVDNLGGDPIVISIMSHSSLLGYMLARKLSSKCHIISFSGGDAAISSMTGIWLEKIRLDYYLYSKLAIAVNRSWSIFVATTNLMKKQMMKVGIKEDRIVLIPRFVEDRFFQVDPTDGILEESRIVFVGRFSREKGIKTLMNAFNMVVKKVPEAKLRLLGEGPMRSYIEKHVQRRGLQRNVEIVGRVPYERIDMYLGDSTVFVLPSLNEGLPNALLQAMAAGLPVVASRVGGIPEVVRDGVDGILVNPGSPYELAKGITSLLMDRERAIRLGRNAKASAERYGVDKVIRKYAALFERCLGKRGF